MCRWVAAMAPTTSGCRGSDSLEDPGRCTVIKRLASSTVLELVAHDAQPKTLDDRSGQVLPLEWRSSNHGEHIIV